jgi:hypothetical protein
MTSTADSTSASWTPSSEPEPTQAISSKDLPPELTEPEGSTEPHPLDDPRPPAQPVEPVEPVRRGRGLGANRHLSSIVLCLLAVVGAYGAVDFGFYRASVAQGSGLLDGRLPDQTMIWLGVAGACMLVAGLCARISALGPLLVGLVLGVGPTVWVLLDYASFAARLDDLPELWSNTTFGISAASFAVFPVVGGVLVGAALAGRWRRPLKKSDL